MSAEPGGSGTAMEEFRQRLLEMKQAVAHAVETRLHGQGEHRHDDAGLPRHSDETDDDGAAETARQADVAHLARSATALRDIEAALARLDSGEYGLCVDCEEAIDQRRLLAHPAALRCARCQQHHEVQQSRAGARP